MTYQREPCRLLLKHFTYIEVLQNSVCLLHLRNCNLPGVRDFSGPASSRDIENALRTQKDLHGHLSAVARVSDVSRKKENYEINCAKVKNGNRKTNIMPLREGKTITRTRNIYHNLQSVLDEAHKLYYVFILIVKVFSYRFGAFRAQHQTTQLFYSSRTYRKIGRRPLVNLAKG